MNRIMVIGVSAGVGKSTFARSLGSKLSIPVTHLDALYWEPNWTEATSENFTRRQQEVISQEQWIIEGNYTGTFPLRFEKADTIIYLELPLYLCFYRAIKRYIQNRGKTRIDIGEGCEEKLDWPFIHFILTTYRQRKKKMKEEMKHFTETHRDGHVFVLKSRKEIQRFLDSL